MTEIEPKRRIDQALMMKEKIPNDMKSLALKCLQFKWIEDQKKNLNRILTPCAFCFDVKPHRSGCSKCKIPKILCNSEGNEGYIGYLLRKYGNIFLKDIKRNEYDIVRNALRQIHNTGKLSDEFRARINLLISEFGTS